MQFKPYSIFGLLLSSFLPTTFQRDATMTPTISIPGPVSDTMPTLVVSLTESTPDLVRNATTGLANMSSTFTTELLGITATLATDAMPTSDTAVQHTAVDNATALSTASTNATALLVNTTTTSTVGTITSPDKNVTMPLAKHTTVSPENKTTISLENKTTISTPSPKSNATTLLVSKAPISSSPDRNATMSTPRLASSTTGAPTRWMNATSTKSASVAKTTRNRNTAASAPSFFPFALLVIAVLCS